MAKATKSVYQVWFRKYGPHKDKNGEYPVLIEHDKGEVSVDINILDPEKALRQAVGSPPSGLSMDYSWQRDE